MYRFGNLSHGHALSIQGYDFLVNGRELLLPLLTSVVQKKAILEDSPLFCLYEPLVCYLDINKAFYDVDYIIEDLITSREKFVQSFFHTLAK